MSWPDAAVHIVGTLCFAAVAYAFVKYVLGGFSG